MQPARIAGLLEPFLAHPDFGSGHQTGKAAGVLSPAQLNSILMYIDILSRWNSRINLTAIRDPEEIVTRHFGESLFAARHLFPEKDEDSDSVADLGSGAGFPGIPMKLWAPGINLTLIESSQKKSVFLREVCRALELSHVEVRNVRAENLAPGLFKIVALRAVERFSEILPSAARLSAAGGRLALLISLSQVETAHRKLPRVSWRDPIPVPGSDSRILLLSENSRALDHSAR